MLAIEPAAGVAPVVQVIDQARQQVDLNVYALTSSPVVAALKNACRRGVHVRVILDSHPYHAQGLVAKEKRKLGGSCIQLKRPPPRFSQKYAFDHAKYVVVDAASDPHEELGTANFTYSAFHFNREYLWISSSAVVGEALSQIFNADWNREPLSKEPRQTLVISPGSTQAITRLIGQPGPVDIEMEELSDDWEVMDALKKKGAEARLILPAKAGDSEAKNIHELTAAGVQVHRIDKPYMHAKMIVGNSAGFIGSENFSYPSLANNREVGIEFADEATRSQLQAQFASDWRKSSAF